MLYVYSSNFHSWTHQLLSDQRCPKIRELQTVRIGATTPLARVQDSFADERLLAAARTDNEEMIVEIFASGNFDINFQDGYEIPTTQLFVSPHHP